MYLPEELLSVKPGIIGATSGMVRRLEATAILRSSDDFFLLGVDVHL